MKITPIILAGGSGTRLWPISRQSKPKQFSNFFGAETLFQKTILRFNSEKFSAPIIICNHEHRFIVASQLDEIAIKPRAIILEPYSRNTATAIASVAHYIQKQQNGDEIMIICPADHLILDEKNFINRVTSAQELAKKDLLLTFGIKPKYAETGYGYILKSNSIDAENKVYAVEKFIEKPSKNRAEEFAQNPDYYWNSGIFLFSTKTYLRSLQELSVELFENTKKAVEKAQKDLDFIRLENAEYEKCENISIDYAVMEKAKNIALALLDIDWNDVGSWESIYNSSAKNSDQNFIEGKIVALNTKNCYLKSDSQLVACLGLNNLIVVATKDAILVADINDSQNIKKLFDIIKTSHPEYCLNHRVCLRPWGSFEVIDAGPNFKVKKILVNARSALSLQKHQHRAEHWVVVRGTASITCDTKIFELNQNESTFIPLGQKHRLENKTDDALEIIEIQSGNYLEEDDIQRFSDNYGR